MFRLMLITVFFLHKGSLFALSLREFYSMVMSSETKKPLLTMDLWTFEVSKTHFNNFDVVGGIMDILRYLPTSFQ